MARILIITPKQPSGNPRMRKSADALAEAGHEVHVLYAYNADWATTADESILPNAPWTFERIGGDPHTDQLTYQWTRAWRKAFELSGNIERAMCRGFSTYVKKGIAWDPDLIIGHNPGALGPLLRISKKLQVPALFDAEDFHRGESAQPSAATVRVTQLEDATLSQLKQISAASPLIAEAYRALYPQLNVTTVNNAFPSHYLATEPTVDATQPLSLVWFSQVIGLDRGLREFLQCLYFIPDVPVSIHLLGMASAEVTDEIIQLVTNANHHIEFFPPLPEKQLFDFIAQHEIGLALEIGEPPNRDLCRTNKLYTYPLSGCYTLASRTTAQIQFFEEFPSAGRLINLENPESMARVLKKIFQDRQGLVKHREQARLLALTTLNWDRESKILVSVVENLV